MSNTKYVGAQTGEDYFKAMKTRLAEEGVSMREAVVRGVALYLGISSATVEAELKGGEDGEPSVSPAGSARNYEALSSTSRQP